MAKPEENALVLRMQELDNIQKECTELSTRSARSFSDALKYSMVSQQIMNALSLDVLNAAILPLRNKDFGWREDTAGKYSPENIRDVMVSAILAGALPTNNEILIISGRFYPQKSFFTRKLSELPGLTELVLLPGKCSTSPAGALVEFTAKWKYNGKDMTMTRTGGSAIPVRLNNGQGVDAAYGKAERKLKAAIYNQLTGSTFAEGEAEVEGDSFAQAVGRVLEAEIAEETPQPTQAEVVKAALKKTAPEAAAAPAGPTPWATDAAETTESTATVSAGKPHAAGFVKNQKTGEFEPVAATKKVKTEAAPLTATGPTGPSTATEVRKPAPTPPATTTTAPAATSIVGPKFDGSGNGEIVTTEPFEIKGIKAGKDRKPPYRILNDSATEFWSSDVKDALKAKEFQTANVPIKIEYTVDAEGYSVIHSMVPADFGNGEAPPSEDENM